MIRQYRVNGPSLRKIAEQLGPVKSLRIIHDCFQLLIFYQ